MNGFKKSRSGQNWDEFLVIQFKCYEPVLFLFDYRGHNGCRNYHLVRK